MGTATSGYTLAPGVKEISITLADGGVLRLTAGEVVHPRGARRLALTAHPLVVHAPRPAVRPAAPTVKQDHAKE